MVGPVLRDTLTPNARLIPQIFPRRQRAQGELEDRLHPAPLAFLPQGSVRLEPLVRVVRVPRLFPIEGRFRTRDNVIPRTGAGLKVSSQTVIDSAAKVIGGHRAQPDRGSQFFPELLVFLIAFNDDEGP